MPLYVADYLADTGHLSTLEHGAYMLLIMHYWQKGGLPDDDKRLASIARASLEQWSDMRSAMAEFFDNGWKHARIDEELENAAKAYERRAAAGKAGGKAKAGLKQSSSNATAGLKQSQPQSHKEETTPSGVVSAAPPENDMDALQSKLLDAVGEGNIQPHGVLDLSAILGLIAAGVDLETDVLPTIRARAQRLKRPAGSWAYFADAIRDAHAKRIEAGQGVAKPKSIEATEDRWRQRIELARREKAWSAAEWGPPPGHPSCRAPPHLLDPGDGLDWREWEKAA